MIGPNLVNSSSHGLYIHIPFCLTICPYCSFYKVPYSKEAAELFVHQLCLEMGYYHQHYGRLNIDTLFMGGGTPNALPKRLITKIMASLHANFNLKNLVEFSMEMNPGVHSLSKLTFFKSIGVNRVSIGAQAFSNQHLQDYGRNHTVSDTLSFIENVQSLGFDSFNVDIMFGHPNHAASDLDPSLEYIIAHKVPHIALYGLTIYKGTPFWDAAMHVDNDAQAEQYSIIQRRLTSHGYRQYEISNFSRPGHECKHNIKYWTFQPTIGLGPGAHSYFNNHHYANPPHYANYLNKNMPHFLTNNHSKIGVDLYLATRLRYQSFISKQSLLDRFNCDIFSQIQPKLSMFSAMGWIDLKKDKFRLSKKGCLLLDELVGHLDIH